MLLHSSHCVGRDRYEGYELRTEVALLLCPFIWDVFTWGILGLEDQSFNHERHTASFDLTLSDRWQWQKLLHPLYQNNALRNWHSLLRMTLKRPKQGKERTVKPSQQTSSTVHLLVNSFACDRSTITSLWRKHFRLGISLTFPQVLRCYCPHQPPSAAT